MIGRASETAAPARTSRGTVLLTAAAIAAVDLIAKGASEARLAESTVDLGVIQLQLAYNSGVAFSMGDKLPAGVVVAITAAISVAFVLYAWHRAPRAGRMEQIAGGAVTAAPSRTWPTVPATAWSPTTCTPAGGPPSTSPTHSSSPDAS